VGGDEFTVILENIQDPADAIRVAQRLQKEIGVPFALNEQEIVVSASIASPCSLLLHKGGGFASRRPTSLCTERSGAGNAHEIFDLRFTVVHSPGCVARDGHAQGSKGRNSKSLSTHRIVEDRRGDRFESWARWQTSDGLLLPGQFIQAANDTGLIFPSTERVLREACHHLQSWCALFPAVPKLSMSLNVSAREFADPDFASDIAMVLRQTGVEPSSLQFEIMETVVMEDARRASEVFSQLKSSEFGSASMTLVPATHL